MPLKENSHNTATFSSCHGCSLCLLSCPMWRQKHDVRFSPQGLAKALQWGANTDDLNEVLSTCIDCGACDVLCPEKIDLAGLINSVNVDAGFDDDAYAISRDPNVQRCLSANDLYVIDAKVFHANHATRVGHYDALRKNTGCNMNLDLNRMAIPTGIGSMADKMQCFDVKQQLEWLVQGRRFERIVIENNADKEAFEILTNKPVIHVSELMEQQPHA